jgi:tetratricopeptide (TPR) repeat protein
MRSKPLFLFLALSVLFSDSSWAENAAPAVQPKPGAETNSAADAEAAAKLKALNKPAEKKKEDTTGKKWQAPVPSLAENSDTWQKLIPALRENGMPYGAMAATRSMLNFFADLQSKELAYKTIIELVDLGYPTSVRAMFIPGDIEPNASTDFGRNYFFYKGLSDLDKKMDHWAASQFEKIDKDNFPKYVFFQAVQAYNAGKLDDAIGLLKRALSLTSGAGNLSLARKEARTLARIYYEKEEFEKSMEIYSTFLLKLNPITPSDWLEAAWNLYRMKLYPEALGYTYNFESQSAGPTPILEKYILRALIYREYCLVKNVGLLSKSFETQFGKVLDGIKLGEPLTAHPSIVKIDHPETIEYRQAIRTMEELQLEQKHVSDLPKDLRPLADYLYTAELKMLAHRKQILENDALQALAKHLVILGESLKYLRFDVVREKFNPENVFTSEKPPEVLVDNTDDETFRIHWRQYGDFWRDERMIYRGNLKSQCDN